MAKYCLEYKMHWRDTPYFIEDGGHFPDGGKMVGLSEDDSKCYIPPAPLVKYATEQDLIDRVVAMSLQSDDGSALTEVEKTALAEAWWLKHMGA